MLPADGELASQDPSVLSYGYDHADLLTG